MLYYICEPQRIRTLHTDGGKTDKDRKLPLPIETHLLEEGGAEERRRVMIDRWVVAIPNKKKVKKVTRKTKPERRLGNVDEIRRSRSVTGRESIVRPFFSVVIVILL